LREKQKETPMRMSLAVGLALAVGGAMLLAMGLNATDAPAEQITEALTGRRSARTEWSIIGGAAMLVAGAVLAGAALVRARG
jgi:hypothetical protein